MAQPILPDEICSFIRDMACRKVHNGKPSNHGLMIGMDIDFDKKIEGDLERTLERWVVDSLYKAHRALDNANWWHFVATVQHDQWQNEGDDEDRMNGYRVVVHFDRHQDEDRFPLYSYSNEKTVHVAPAHVLSHFETPPVFVRSIGISGVNERLMRDGWAETITKTPNCVDRAGKGYMLHRMWRFAGENYHDTENAPEHAHHTVREMSFNFGWENYPGNRGENW